MSEQWLIEGKVSVRPDDLGGFDELLVYDGEHCIVHAEMMDDKCLWIGITPKDEPDRRVVMWVNARGKLRVKTEED